MKSVEVAPGEKSLPLLINRNFALLWCGQSISLLGDQVFTITLLLWVGSKLTYHLSWSPLAVSGILLASSLPIFVFGPLAGVFADRWDKRATMLWMDGLRAIMVLLLMLCSGFIPLPFTVTGHLPLQWQLDILYVVVACVAVCGELFNPSRIILIGDLVPESKRAQASSLQQTTANIALIIGAPIAAALLFGVGVQWAIGLNALSFVISCLTLLAVQIPKNTVVTQQAPHTHILQEFGAGVHFLVTHRVLRTILIGMFVLLLGGGFEQSLNFFFVVRNLHATPVLYGLLDSASGIGILTGVIGAGWITSRLGVARMFWFSILVMGIAELVYARLTNFSLAYTTLLFQGIFNGFLNVALGPLVLKATPRIFLGRVWALISPAMQLATLISTAFAGYLVSTSLRNFHAVLLGLAFGPIDTLILFAGISGIAAGLFAMIQLRDWRKATL